MGQGVLAGQEHAFQVDIQDPVPGFFADFNRSAVCPQSDVVIQDVDPAVSLDTFLHQALAVAGFGHISLEDKAIPAFLIDGVLGLFSGLRIQINQHDPGTLPGEENSCRLADAYTGGD